jgi:predicted HD superfamily hydrolase involved in NAD metabolism
MCSERRPPETHINGIPIHITPEVLRKWVKPRVKSKRFKHIEGVVEVAKKLARKAGCDEHLAEIAAWIHDACKHVKDEELVSMARHYGLVLSDLETHHGHLLHGPVAAELAMHELDITNEDVLNAIAEHTLGAMPMSTLSKVLYLADALEESRPEDFRQPIWDALDFDGIFDLDNALVVACELGIKHLKEAGKPVHPRTEAVRAYYSNLN